MENSESIVAKKRGGKPGNRGNRHRGIEGSTREKALAIAEELIAVHGPEDFQLQDVAHRLGVKPPALYNHFASREELVAEVARNLSRASTEFMVRKPGEDSMTAFRTYARKLVAFYVRRPAAARIYLFEISKGGVKDWEESAAHDSWARDRASRAFERSVRAGEFRDIRFGYYVSVVIAGLAALALWPSYDRASRRVSIDRLQAEADDLVVRLLSPDSPSPDRTRSPS